MIKICTVYFEGKYTPDYVEKLYNGLKRYCTLPFEFICYSDNPNVKADRIIPLPNPKHTDIKIHWHKLTFFSPLFGFQEPDDEIIIMDIDQIIVNNIDKIIGWPVADNELVSYDKWWGGYQIIDGQYKNRKTYGLKLNGGFYKFKSSSCQIIWDEFIKCPEVWQLHYFKNNIVTYKYYGEQNFVNWMCEKHKIKLTLMTPEWVCKLSNDKKQDYKNNIHYMKKFNQDYMILDKPNPLIKIIHFANPEADIHNSKYSWIKDYWK